jgi:hypothetical protein
MSDKYAYAKLENGFYDTHKIFEHEAKEWKQTLIEHKSDYIRRNILIPSETVRLFEHIKEQSR